MEAKFPHPSLTAQEAEVLTLLAEEANEVAIECSKILRSGRNFCRRGREVTNVEHLTTEWIDFAVLSALAVKLGLIDETMDFDALGQAKAEKLKQWSNLGDLVEQEFGA